MAVAGTVKLEVIASAQENIRAVLKQSNQAIRQTQNQLDNARASQAKMGGVTNKLLGSVNKLKAGFVAMGIAAAVAVGKQLFDMAKQGAALADQLDAVKGRVENADEIIRATQEATTGIVDEAAITKGIALFDAFGLELDALPALFEQASKTSLRTGESIDHLISSAVTGVARMSPPILDNLGLQVRLSDATQAAAEKFELEADALDETQKKAGMLSLVLKKLGTLNKDIDLNKSRAASLQRLEVQYKDTTDGIAMAFSDLFKTSGDRMEEFAKRTADAVGKSSEKWSELADDVHNEVNRISLSLEKAEGDQLRSASMTTLFSEKTVELERAKVDAIVRLRSAEGAAFQEAISLRTVLEQKGTELKIYDAERWAQIQREHQAEATAINDEEMRMIDARFKSRHSELVEADALAQVRIEHEREALSILQGATSAQLRKAEAQKEYNIQAKEGTELSRAAAFAELKAAIASEQAEKTKLASSRSVIATTKDITKEIQSKIDAQLFSNKLEQTTGDRGKILLQMEEKRRQLKVDIAKLDGHGLAISYEKARVAGIELEQKRLLAALETGSDDAKERAFASAQFALEIAQATTETQRIDLELQEREAEIAESSLSLNETALSIDLARLEAQRAKADIAQDERDAFAETLGAGIGGAFGDAAGLFAQMDRQLEELGRPAKYKNVIRGMQSMSQTVPQATKEFALLGKTSNTMGQDVAAGVSAGLSVVGPATAAFIDNVRDQALVMGAFEAAMAVAQSFVNTSAAISHGIASVMFFAMAGIAASQPKTSVSEEEKPGAGGLITPAGDAPEEREAASFTINLGPGTIFGLPQEMGAQIAERINSMTGSGFEESTAF